MSENTAVEETTETITEDQADVAPAVSDDTPEVESAEEPEPTNKAGREAAKYRRQLRETEAELDTLRSHLEAARATQVAHEVSALRVQNSQQLRPEAIGDLDTSGLYDQSGALDKNLLQQRLNELQAAKPYTFRTNYEGTFIIPSEGGHPNFSKVFDGDGNPMASAFRPDN